MLQKWDWIGILTFSLGLTGPEVIADPLINNS